MGLTGIGRSHSAPAETLRSYAASYAASLLHQVRRGSGSIQSVQIIPLAPPSLHQVLSGRVRLTAQPYSGNMKFKVIYALAFISDRYCGWGDILITRSQQTYCVCV